MNVILQKLHAYYIQFLRVLPRLALAILVVVAGILLASWLANVMRRRLGARSHDPLMSNFLSKATKVALIITVLMLGLNLAGLSSIAGGLVATAGASVLVLGFAFKDIAENFLAGVILAFNRPFQVNDTVKVEDIFGRVKAMEFRYTKIETFDGRSVYIPNSDVLTKPVINYTEDGFYRTDFIVGIAYEDDIEKAKDIIYKCMKNAEGVVHDDKHANFVAEDELAASTVNLKVYFWVGTEDFRRGTLITRGVLMKEVKEKLTAAGINLPADIRELKFYDASSNFAVDVNEKKPDNAAGE